MMRSLNIGAGGMMAQQTNVDVISNNIANLSTTGYKRQRAAFQDLIYQNLRHPGATSSDTGTVVPAGIQLGLGVKTSEIARILEQGTLSSTNRPLDVAIEGKGYLQITLPDGRTAYTRDGSLSLSPTGEIVTADGYSVQPSVAVPHNARSITIDETGQVSVQIDGQTAPQVLGQFQMATFVNDAGLEAVGRNLFIESAASGSPVTGVAGSSGFGNMQQGFLETSNVNVVNELTTLITAQRSYEMNSKVIETSDKMMGTVSQMQ
jgi:flagellar basal-body rod protein FlgG